MVLLVREAKQNHILSDPNLPSKKWFKIANDITNLKNRSNPLPPFVTSAQVNIHPLILNEHFSNISKVENEPTLPENDNHAKNFISINITEQDVKDQHYNLNEAKPDGPDELLSKMIKLFRNLNLLHVPYYSVGRMS